MTDLTFQDPKGLVNRAAFNERFSVLNGLYRYWWKRKSVSSHYEIEETNDITEDSSFPTEDLYATASAYDGTEFDIQYSDEVYVDETGKLQLRSPSTVKLSYSVGYAQFQSVIPGKYFKPQTDETSNLPNPKYEVLYAVSSGKAMSTVWSARNAYVVWWSKIRGVSSKYVESTGEWEYVYSSDRNAYPDSGEQNGYEYQFLGIPFENAREAPKIATGSYVGTGTYGASSPNSLTLDFEPKLVIVGDLIPARYSSGEWSNSFIWTSGQTYTYITGDEYAVVTLSLIGFTLKWFASGNTMNAANQCNTLGTTYRWTALG